MKNNELLGVVANAPHDLEVVASINGVIQTSALSVEVKGGQLVIGCEAEMMKSATPSSREKSLSRQLDELANGIVEFGEPSKGESACAMAVRLLREQAAQIETLTAPAVAVSSPAPVIADNVVSDEPGEGIELR